MAEKCRTAGHLQIGGKSRIDCMCGYSVIGTTPDAASAMFTHLGDDHPEALYFQLRARIGADR